MSWKILHVSAISIKKNSSSWYQQNGRSLKFSSQNAGKCISEGRTLLETRASGPLVPGFLSYSTFRTPSSKSKSQENQNYKLPFRRPQFSFPENEMTFVRTVMTCAMEKISSHDIAFTFSSISATNPQETIFFLSTMFRPHSKLQTVNQLTNRSSKQQMTKTKPRVTKESGHANC